MANAIGGTQLGMYGASAQMDRAMDKIVDYSKCPNCGSKDLSYISVEEMERIKAERDKPQAAASVSSADELLKFKQLLDSGIIT